MTTLIAAILELAANTPPERAEFLSKLFARMVDKKRTAEVEAWALNPKAKNLLNTILTAWSENDVPSLELAGMIAGASAAYHQVRAERHVELVWTGPSSTLVPTRQTEQALLEVVEAARTRMFVTSFVAYKADHVVQAFAKAMSRGVRLSLLLEPAQKHGGGASFDVIGNMKKDLSSAEIYSWTQKSGRYSGGIVHAKIAVADEEICFVSSANLTESAMESNMEAGILIKGGSVPRDLHRHLEALETMRIITRV